MGTSCLNDYNRAKAERPACGSTPLSGKVDSWSERKLATNTAWASPGLKSVVDKITLSY